MSADSQGDTGNLNKDEESPTATHSEGIPVTSIVDENIHNQTNTDRKTLVTPASKDDIPINDDKEDNDEEIETIIEKKLPNDKDKGLDVDSELDFELKWDDDTDLNEDRLDTGNEIESTLTSIDEGIDSVSNNAETVPTSFEKDLDDSEKDTESILTSIDEGLDSVTKDLETTTTSNVKDLDNEDNATESILTSTDEALESKDVEMTLTSIDKVIDNADEEMQSTLTPTNKGLSSMGQDIETTIASSEKEVASVGPEIEVAMPSVEKDNDNDHFDCEMENVDINKALETNVMDIDKSAEETQSKLVEVLVHSDKLKKIDISEDECETLNVVTGRIDLDTKSSPNESEANSLDEQLVYSDVEVPDIEDKDLLDEIDAQIAETKESIEELEIKDTEKIQALPEPSTSQEECKENETPQKELSKLDVDSNLINSTQVTEKSDLNDKVQGLPEFSTSQEECKENEAPQKDLLSELDVDSNLMNSTQLTQKSDRSDTCASIMDMDTSSYDINNEHGLDRPDVMLDIPTQELIESFDDTAVEHKDKLEEFENVINNPDLIESTTSEEDYKILTESEATVDNTKLVQFDKNDDLKSTYDTVFKDEVESVVRREISTDDIAKKESMDVDNIATSEEAIKPCKEHSEGNTNIETIKLIQEKFSAIEEKLSHTNIVLKKPNQENLALTEEKINEGDIILEANSEQPKKLNADKSSPNEENLSEGDIILEANSEQPKKLNADKSSPNEENLSEGDIILEANSEQPKELCIDADKSSPTEKTEVNKEIIEKSFSNQDLKDVESKAQHIDVAQSSTSKDHQELSDEDQAASKPKHFDVAQPSTSKDHQELSDENQEASKPKDIDVAQPSTAKDHQELSDEDQQISKTKDIDIAQSSVSKDHQELSDEDQETSKPEDIVVVQSSVSKDHQELSDEDPEASKPKDIDVAQPSTCKDHQELSNADQEASKSKDIDVAHPSTSKDHQELSDENQEASKPKDIDVAQPSTSKDHQELSDEDQETTDSLGLLAESSRIMDDEDEQEQENEAEDDDDDDDFDQDDESNQMTAEHSEDSNAQHSESDVPKESMEVDESNDAAEPQIDDTAEIQDMETETSEDPEVYDVDSHVDESSADKDDFQIQIGAVVSEKPEIETEAEDSSETTAEPPESIEAQKAVEALLEDKPAEEEESNDVPEPAASVEEAVKLPEDADFTAIQNSRLRALLLKDSSDSSNETSEAEQRSISKPIHDINIVELEESSSEDDVQVCNQDQPEPTPTTPKKVAPAVEVASSEEESSELQKKEISDVPKPAAVKPTKPDTEKAKTVSPAAKSPVTPETTAPKTPEAKTPIDFGAEIFSLDSDDEDAEDKNKNKKKLTAVEIDKAGETNKCINILCTSDTSVPLVPASISASVYYAANPQRGSGLCLNCAQRFEDRSKKLIEGVKDFTPYLNMDMGMVREELVEISDSDSDDDVVKKDDEILGEKGVKFLEEQLADMLNETWKKYDMEARLLTAQTEISLEVRQLEEECKKIDAMLHDCQTDTDKLRNDLYGTFADDRRILPSISIFDTPTNQWSGLEELLPPPVENKEPRPPKRRLPAPAEPTAKRPAIPLGYAPLDANKEPDAKPTEPPAEIPLPPEDDNADISVVKLSVESAPAGLPPPGTATRPPLKPNMMVYAMRNSFGAWHKVRIVEVLPKVAGQFTTCRVRFEHPKSTSKVLPARCLAYEHAPDVRLTIGTRVVALFRDHRNLEDVEKKEAYYSGIVAEIPNPVNNFRYLIFFDDGYAQYVQHAVTRLVCECAARVWDEVHPFSRQFVRDYLRAYPERPMVRLHAGQNIKTEWNGRWWPSRILQVDASLVHVSFDGKKEAGVDKTEWIYRGSTRLAPLFLELQAAERQRSRPLPRAQAGRRFNMPYVEYTRPDEPSDPSKPAPPESPVKTLTPAQTLAQTQAQIEQEIRRQRAVAKKSTAVAPPPQPVRENVTSRVVYYSPKNAIKPHKWVPHTCGPQCKRTDVLALKDLRTYNPLTKPLLSGWERHTLRFRAPQSKTAMYRAPCGRRIRNHRELHQYLQAIESDMSVDLFDFNGHTHCLAEFVLNKCIVSKKDLSHGKENVPVPCVNYYDDALPEFCSYNTERTPTAGVPLNLDPEFLCGCDCTDDCADKSKCACWKMTLEGARTIGLDTNEVGYVYKRLPEPLPSGIYECNSRCKCRQTCLNRVAQHPLQLKLQVFKTANRGWGIRALNDVPKGAFLCVYAGNLLTDATANLDGLNEGDEYLAELDYIEVVEQMKEGFEEDIPDDAKKLDQDDSSLSSLSSDEEPARDADDDFRPALPTGQYRVNAYSKRLRKRESKKAKENEEKEKKAKGDKEKNSEDCITISDDEELREPARFAARSGMGGKEFISKYKSVRAHFGKDEACYIMDAKVQGNIGRYLNHSCTPNVFVQNVFVDTHDPRFPWVAFFALSHIKAGTELTWNYNYDVGSVPGKVLYCYCNAPNCRGRLL